MSTCDITSLTAEAICLLQELIRLPSFSKEEDRTAAVIRKHLEQKGIPVLRTGNNIYARNRHFVPGKPVLLLNSHHDTVQPNQGYTRDPFLPSIEDEKLYGLGSNDAGGCLVSLIAAFCTAYEWESLPFNLVLAATAEEEISGKGGIELLLQDEHFCSYTGYRPETAQEDWSAIVGEPTRMQLAIAERGLLVMDGYAEGIAGHAARNEGSNALYKALDDINTLRQFRFEQISPFLGPVQISVTAIRTENQQHNVVPAGCHFLVDVRVNEYYTLERVWQTLQAQVQSRLQPRSLRLRSTGIDPEHPLVRAGRMCGAEMYGSPTTSDKALMPFPALKMGPGDSARSHMADEYIYLEEIRKGINTYLALLQNRIKTHE